MRRHAFSLIELLIVVGILGALSALILPAFQNTNKEAKQTVAKTKMKDIQGAFSRFYGDMLSEMLREEVEGEGASATRNNFYLEDIALYGVWPLLIRNHPKRTEADDWTDGNFKQYPLFNETTSFGWRGPYLEQDGVREIAEPTLKYDCRGKGMDTVVVAGCEGGQTEEVGSSYKIPVIMDPYGGYFRVLCPEARKKSKGGNNLPLNKRLRRMVLVCTGPNRKLETTTDSFRPETDDSYIKHYNADDLVAGGDDTIIRLLPTAN